MSSQETSVNVLLVLGFVYYVTNCRTIRAQNINERQTDRQVDR